MRVVAVHFRERDTAEAALHAVRVLTRTPAEQWSVGRHEDGWIVAGRYPAEMRDMVLGRYVELGGILEIDIPLEWTRAAPASGPGGGGVTPVRPE